MRTTSFYITKDKIVVMLHNDEEVEKFIETLRRKGIEIKDIKVIKCG